MRTLVFFSLMAMVSIITGCAESTDSAAEATPAVTDTATDPAAAEVSSEPVNANCPIMGHPIAADGGSTTWNGKTIGFCCEGCAPKFDALSDEEKAAKLAAADSGDHADHGDADSTESAGDADT